MSIIPSIRIRGGENIEHTNRQLKKVTDELSQALAQVGLSIVIGGIDVSRNRHKAGKFRAHFQFHLWAFAPFEEAQKARQRLSALFPKKGAGPRTVWVNTKPMNGNLTGFAYAMKTEFRRRDTLPAGFAADGKWRKQNTRNGRPLTIAEHVPLLLMLHMLGLEGRLLLHGVSLETDKMGRPVIRPVLRK